MIYNRALHIDDYNGLAPWVNHLNEFEHYLSQQRVPYRKDHKHREWEYASVLQQLAELAIPKTALVVDTGSGGSYLPPLLARDGWRIVVADSMDYGDFVDDILIPQCTHLALEIPVLRTPVENMHLTADEAFDVTMCISVIEHLHPSSFEDGLKELKRITKPGGHIFITSDFFRDEEQANKSPYRQIQHTIFTPDVMADIPRRMGYGVSWVGPLNFEYRGDFVHNYSFCNMCLRKDG